MQKKLQLYSRICLQFFKISKHLKYILYLGKISFKFKDVCLFRESRYCRIQKLHTQSSHSSGIAREVWWIGKVKVTSNITQIFKQKQEKATIPQNEDRKCSIFLR